MCERDRKGKRNRPESITSLYKKVCAAQVMMFDVWIFFRMTVGRFPRTNRGTNRKTERRGENERGNSRKTLIKKPQKDLHSRKHKLTPIFLRYIIVNIHNILGVPGVSGKRKRQLFSFTL